MSKRKRPQQELANYFDELLTELDEVVTDVSFDSPNNIDNDNHDKGIQQEPVVEQQSQVILPTQQKWEGDCSTILSRDESALDAALPVANNSVVNNVQPLSKDQPKIQTSPQFSEKEAALDKIQQAKLQRLLRNLVSTDVDVSAEVKQQLADKFLGKGAAILDTPKVASESPVVEQDITTTAATVVNHEATGRQLWQPLSAQWADNGRPEWAQAAFDILIVTVNNVNLAMPLQALDSIYPIESEITPLFAQAKWFMGLQQSLTGNIKVIDTTQFLMPERIEKYPQTSFKYTITINGSGWGLAVNALAQPLTVEPDSIRWRMRRSERPWFAGTVKDHMCVLLDIPVLAKTLMQRDKRRGFIVHDD